MELMSIIRPFKEKEIVTVITGRLRRTKVDRSRRCMEVTRWSPHIVKRSEYNSESNVPKNNGKEGVLECDHII